MKKNIYRKSVIILGFFSILGTFLLSYLTLTQYNIEFVFIFTFFALILSLFGILLVFLLTKEDKK